jgi:hypothetical protein
MARDSPSLPVTEYPFSTDWDGANLDSKWTRLESCVEVSAVAPRLNAPLGSAFAFDDQGYQFAATSQRCGQCSVAPTLRVFVAQLVDQSVPLGPVLLSDAVRFRCLRVEFLRARGSRL